MSGVPWENLVRMMEKIVLSCFGQTFSNDRERLLVTLSAFVSASVVRQEPAFATHRSAKYCFLHYKNVSLVLGSEVPRIISQLQVHQQVDLTWAKNQIMNFLLSERDA